MIQQQQQQQHQHQQHQQHQQMMMSHGQPPPSQMGQYGASPQHPQGRGNSPPAPGQEPTTSDDSDDSTPHPAIVSKRGILLMSIIRINSKNLFGFDVSSI